MIIKQIAIFFATYLLSEKVSRAQSNWITDSTKAFTYSAITTMFISRMSELLRKSLFMIPLTTFGTVLAILCYIDLMDALDYGAIQLQVSFWVNAVVSLICFFVAIYAYRQKAPSKEKAKEEGLTEVSADVITEPFQNAGEHVQENFAFFKRGFEQAFEKHKLAQQMVDNSYD